MQALRWLGSWFGGGAAERAGEHRAGDADVQPPPPAGGLAARARAASPAAARRPSPAAARARRPGASWAATPGGATRAVSREWTTKRSVACLEQVSAKAPDRHVPLVQNTQRYFDGGSPTGASGSLGDQCCGRPAGCSRRAGRARRRAWARPWWPWAAASRRCSRPAAGPTRRRRRRRPPSPVRSLQGLPETGMRRRSAGVRRRISVRLHARALCP